MSLGALIAKSRTAARLSIEDLSNLTNIPGSLLRDMENNNFKKCGGETYARGHLRNIAAKLGVDERLFLDLFESEITAPAKPIRELLNENNAAMPYKEHKQVSWKVLAAGSLIALVFFGGAQVIFSNIKSSNDPVAATTSESASPAATTSATTSATTKATPTGSPATVTAGALKVEISATRGSSWLYVTNENGTTIFSGQMRQGDKKLFSDAKQVNLRVGNAGGVDISVNGKNVGSLGANGDVVNLTYNAN